MCKFIPFLKTNKPVFISLKIKIHCDSAKGLVVSLRTHWIIQHVRPFSLLTGMLYHGFQKSECRHGLGLISLDLSL